jgi:hypothetical protein
LAIRVDAIELATDLFGTLTFPRAAVAGILFRPPADAIERDRLRRRLLDEHVARDCVWLLNGDEQDGVAISGDEGGNVTSLRIGDAKTVAELENVVAMVCKPTAPANETASNVWLGLRDGSRLAVAGLDTNPSRVVLRLQSGASLSAAENELWRQTTWVQPIATRFTFLSDRPSAGYKHIPMFSQSWDLGRDQNVLGGNLRSGGIVCAKGLGMHSAARSTYQLAREFRRFESDLGLDDAAGDRGSVIYRVFIDRAAPGQPPQWKLEYESPVIRGGAGRHSLRVDVTGAERMALVVDFADRGDECDYANWLLPRLIK